MKFHALSPTWVIAHLSEFSDLTWVKVMSDAADYIVIESMKVTEAVSSLAKSCHPASFIPI